MGQHFDVFWTDRQGNILQGVKRREEDATVRGNADATLKLAAEISIREIPDWVNPYQHRVLIQRSTSPLGIFRIGKNFRSIKRGNLTHKLTLVDPLRRLTTTRLTTPLTVAAGTNVANTVAEWIRNLGENVEVTPGAQTTLTPQVWMPGTTELLEPINDLLTSANYWGIHTGRTGKFRILPYTLPENRPTTHSFIAGDGSKMVGDYEAEEDYEAIPNRFIAVCEAYQPQGSDADLITLVGIAENKNPNSPYSYAARGEWVDHYDTVEATSQKEIDGIAARRLAALTGGGDYVDIQHAWLPHLWLNDKVHVSTAAGETFDAVVNEFTIPEHGLVTAKLRKVVALNE